MAAGEDPSQYVFHHSVTSRRQENIIQFGQFEIIRCHQDHTSQQSIEAVMAKIELGCLLVCRHNRQHGSHRTDFDASEECAGLKDEPILAGQA